MRVARPCIMTGCGAYARVGSRCPVHQAERRRVRYEDEPIARAVIAASPVCAECGATSDLTADHVRPLARGGTNQGERQTLCRSCNSRKRDR